VWTTTMEKETLSYKQYLDEHGYVIIDGLIPPELIESLRIACDHTVEKARNNEWKLRRVVGVQFPPFPEEAEDVWGVQHVMHPDLQEPIFAQWYGSDKLLEVIKELLEVKEDELQLELFNLLINPILKDYSLTWHRDDIKPDVDSEEESRRLVIPHYGTQWNTALYPDACLYVVPGSHKRLRTPEERHIQINDPLSTEMPGAICVPLDVGQTVFYNNNILHRAMYNKEKKRATLHACIGTTVGGYHRARNILQHGLNWMREERFKNTLPERLLPLYRNLIRLADESKEKDLGYSH